MRRAVFLSDAAALAEAAALSGAAMLGLTASPAAVALAGLVVLAAAANLLLAVLLKRLDRPEEAFGRKLSFKAHEPRKRTDGLDGGGSADGTCGDGD